MSDVFISYARSSEGQAKAVEEGLKSAGYKVWRDDELPAHKSYADVIEERLKSAKAVVVLWGAVAMGPLRSGRCAAIGHPGPGDDRRIGPANAVRPDPMRRPS